MNEPVNEPVITIQDEAVLLHILSHLHPGPFYCWRCRQDIKKLNGWLTELLGSGLL